MASNGKIYAAPYDASHVLEVDPVAGRTRLIGDALPGERKYESTVAASNGKLYAAPCYALRSLEIDPVAGTTRLIGEDIPGHGERARLQLLQYSVREAVRRPSSCTDSGCTNFDNISVAQCDFGVFFVTLY